jgi:formiminoglutamase
MNLSLFFQPVAPDIFENATDKDALFHHLSIHHQVFPDWQYAQIALFGVTEERGTLTNIGTSQAPAAVRQALYRLKKSSGNAQIVDLGDLRPGQTLEDTYRRLQEIVQLLLTFNVLPVILGGSHDLILGQYWGYEGLESEVCLLNIDAYADMESPFSSPLSQNYVHTLLLHEPDYLFNYTLMGFQSYLVNPDAVKALEKMNQKTLRLGQMRDSWQETEPLVREANLVAFDVSALKKTEAPGNASAPVFGLTGEEACQLCWYAGLSERLTSIGFYEYNPLLDKDFQTASVLAVMIWYVLEGFSQRPHESAFESQNYTRFAVQLAGQAVEEIVFFKDTLIDKWWLELRHPRHTHRRWMLPCSYEDYQTAAGGELPYRWVLAYGKL